MPIYVFEHPKTSETIELFFSMNDEKSYVDKSGTEWRRVYLPTSNTIDAQIDPFSSKSFLEKTNTKGTYSDLVDRSQELSEKRINKLGYDPLRKKYFENYAKKRNGLKHHLDK